jgi:sortase A
MKPLTFGEEDLKRIFKRETPTARALRWVKRGSKVVISLAAVYFAIFYLMNFSAFWQRFTYQAQANTAPPPVATETPPLVIEEPVIILPPKITINKLGIDAPVLYSYPVTDILEGLKSGVVRYEGTALPNERGNTVLIGHSSDFPWSTGQYKTVFALLDKLEIGDQIQLTYDNKQFTYAVSKKTVVAPTFTAPLHRTVDPTLTLLTCYPVGSTRSRLIIQADLVSGPVTATQTTEPVIDERPVKPR